MWLKFVRYGYIETLVRMFCMSICVVYYFIEMTGLCKFVNNLIEFGLYGKTICPILQLKMTYIEWGAISMDDPEREQDVVKKEASGSRLGGSYVLGRSQNRIPNLIMRDVNTLEGN